MYEMAILSPGGTPTRTPTRAGLKGKAAATPPTALSPPSTAVLSTLSPPPIGALLASGLGAAGVGILGGMGPLVPSAVVDAGLEDLDRQIAAGAATSLGATDAAVAMADTAALAGATGPFSDAVGPGLGANAMAMGIAGPPVVAEAPAPAPRKRPSRAKKTEDAGGASGGTAAATAADEADAGKRVKKPRSKAAGAAAGASGPSRPAGGSSRSGQRSTPQQRSRTLQFGPGAVAEEEAVALTPMMHTPAQRAGEAMAPPPSGLSPLEEIITARGTGRSPRSRRAPVRSGSSKRVVGPVATAPGAELDGGVSLLKVGGGRSAQMAVGQGAEGGTPGRQVAPATEGCKKCNCRKSKCLKLYCECFSAGVYCDGCACQNCFNTPEHAELVKQTRANIMQRNPHAFAPKIVGLDTFATPARHKKGCNCKKSFCLKKYCECFQAGVKCTDVCGCENCKNFEGAPPPPSNLGKGSSSGERRKSGSKSGTRSGTPRSRSGARTSPRSREIAAAAAAGALSPVTPMAATTNGSGRAVGGAADAVLLGAGMNSLPLPSAEQIVVPFNETDTMAVF